MIRSARPDDLPILREVERAAGEPFRALGMDLIADDEPPSIEYLETFQKDGRAWVFVAEHDQPVAYLLLEVVDGCAHVEQVSVHPRHARRRLGGRLIDKAATWAEQHGLAGLTLTTYADVPWNAPYYQRLGFSVVPEEDLSDGLREIRRHEAERGLDEWPRVTMFRPVPRPADHR